jgi:hypothetical protein
MNQAREISNQDDEAEIVDSSFMVMIHRKIVLKGNLDLSPKGMKSRAWQGPQSPRGQVQG